MDLSLSWEGSEEWWDEVCEGRDLGREGKDGFVVVDDNVVDADDAGGRGGG